MPIYEYKCTACEHSLELVQKFSDDPATECPECHAHALKKQISAAAFHLKGNGWYVTDFRDKKDPSGQKTQDKPSKKTDNKSHMSNSDTNTAKAKDSKKNDGNNKNSKNSKSD